MPSSRLLGDSLTVSEAETDPGDSLCRMDGSSGEASRPSSDNADVSIHLLNLYLLLFSPQFLSQVMCIQNVIFYSKGFYIAI